MEILLMNYFDIRRNLIVPCVSDWSQLTLFEIDLLVLSKSKYATAIEIKVNKSDLKNDLKKKHISNMKPIGEFYLERYYKNIKYFYYAVPEELEEAALLQIHNFSGLLVAKKCNGKNRIIQVRKPKLLFSNQWTDDMRYQLARLGTMRILGLKKKQNNG